MNKFEVIGQIGEGTYGVVLKCRNRLTGQVVAIKKFKETEDNDNARRAMLTEVKLLRLLDHPNIVKLEEVFRCRHRLYLAFEFMDQTLLQKLEASPDGLKGDLVCQIVYQICSAIAFCHSKNVIHRDVKLENFLIDDADGIPVVKLCDFGLARIALKGDEGGLTDYVATRWYRPPELLLRSANYSAAVDVFAIGCIMAELITGSPLFPGEDDIDQLLLIQRSLGPFTAEQRSLWEANPMFFGQPDEIDPTPVDFIAEKFAGLCGKNAISFMKAVLRMDPATRLTSAECLEHPYFHLVRQELAWLRSPSTVFRTSPHLRPPERFHGPAAPITSRSAASFKPGKPITLFKKPQTRNARTMPAPLFPELQAKPKPAWNAANKKLRRKTQLPPVSGRRNSVPSPTYGLPRQV